MDLKSRYYRSNTSLDLDIARSKMSETEATGATMAVSQVVRARTSAKSWLTRAEKTFNELLSRPETEVSTTQIEFAIEQYEKRLDTFDACQQRS